MRMDPCTRISVYGLSYGEGRWGWFVQRKAEAEAARR